MSCPVDITAAQLDAKKQEIRNYINSLAVQIRVVVLLLWRKTLRRSLYYLLFK
jgi:hypothetical protein